MRFRRILYILIPLVIFTIIFILDILRKNVALNIFGVWYLRDVFVIVGFFFSYLFIQSLPSITAVRSPIKRLGSIFILTLIIIVVYALLSFIRKEGFLPVDSWLVPQDYMTIIVGTILSVIAGLTAIAIFLHLKMMVLLHRKKGTRRNFIILLLLLAATSISAFGMHPLESSAFTTILLWMTVIMVIVISFRLSWIVLLSRKEKIYSIVYGVLLFMAFLAINMLFNGTFLDKAMVYYCAPLRYYSFLVSIFGMIYFGLTFVSTLFHLPTADAYERKQSEVNSLHNLGRLVTRVFDFNDLVTTVTKMTLEVCGAQSAWLEMVQQDDDRQRTVYKVETVSIKNITAEQIEILNSEKGNLLRELVVEKKRVVLIDDVARDHRFTHIGKLKKNIGSLLIVPLLSHETMIGILYATKGREEHFDQDDIEVISTFADNVTIAIENSRLIEKSIERERLQREMMLAREMQQKLLPQVIPTNPRYELSAISIPASEVGGDYYDIVNLDINTIGIVVGDVSGKGVSAAFYMAEVKGIFQSLSKMTQSPKQFLVLANNALSGSIDKRSFVSLVYVILDGVGKLRIARAGHCPMLYVGKDEVRYVQPTGLGLGLSRDSIFAESTKEEEIILKNGDICVFYTDGVTEARNQAGDEFGYERLLQVVSGHHSDSAERIRNEIVDYVRRHQEEGLNEDDLTILVLKWHGS
ncbi:MAG: GAF domain-containing SpoIIE family protein phosphatase [Bacteroidota bacterium]